MSESDPNSAQPPRTEAIARRTAWPGWIWAVPIAAVGIVIWLLVRTLSARGIDVTVIYPNAHGMQPDSTRVMYRGVRIGTVSSVELTKDNSHVVVHLDIDRPLAPELRTGTHFFLEGAHPSLSDPASLIALISGPVIVMVPGAGAPQRTFVGIEGSPRETLRVSLHYLVEFNAAVGDLPVHSPVTLRGFTVGEVASVGLEVDPRTGAISTPVVIALDPTRFHLLGPAPAGGDWAPFFDETLGKLVHAGLRAQLTRTLPVIGSRQVVLAIEPGAPVAGMVRSGDLLEIPTAPGGGLAGLSQKLTRLPLMQIAENVRALTAQLRQLASSPQLRDSILHLDRTLAALERTARQAGPEVAPTLISVQHASAQLRGVAEQIDSTARAARAALGTGPAPPNGNLEQTLDELTNAARSIRSLANYLDQHPEALLRGRHGATP